MESELQAAGFATERQSLAVPFFDQQKCELAVSGSKAALWPQPVVIPTGPNGLSGRLVRVDAAGNARDDLAGAIALVDLPSGRWSSMMSPALRTPIEAAFAAGATAAIAITNGPTGRLIALNTDGAAPMFSGPCALLAPRDAAPFLAAALTGNVTARLTLHGTAARRPAFNLVGRIDRGSGEWLVVSTPRSGWFTCAAERGGGIAAWLQIARWAASRVTSHNIAFLCNSGHEYENLGAEEALKAAAPRPEVTSFWLHLGANLAARDWHSAVGTPKPLPGTDTQRYLVTTADLLPQARRLFAGRVGLEAPYDAEDLTAGELTEIIHAGYQSVAGIFGIHRFHHIADDTAQCLVAEETAHTANAFKALVQLALAQ